MRNHMVEKTSFTKIFSLLISFSFGINFLFQCFAFSPSNGVAEHNECSLPVPFTNDRLRCSPETGCFPGYNRPERPKRDTKNKVPQYNRLWYCFSHDCWIHQNLDDRPDHRG